MICDNDLMLQGDIILSLGIKFTTYDMDMYNFLLEDVSLYSLVYLYESPGVTQVQNSNQL